MVIILPLHETIQARPNMAFWRWMEKHYPKHFSFAGSNPVFDSMTRDYAWLRVFACDLMWNMIEYDREKDSI